MEYLMYNLVHSKHVATLGKPTPYWATELMDQIFTSFYTAMFFVEIRFTIPYLACMQRVLKQNHVLLIFDSKNIG